MRLAPRHACALALAAATACSGAEPVSAPAESPELSAAMGGGGIPVAATFGDTGSATLSFAGREITGEPTVYSLTMLTFTPAQTSYLLQAVVAALPGPLWVQITGDMDGNQMSVYPWQVSFTSQQDMHRVTVATTSGSEEAAWQRSESAMGVSYVRRTRDGRFGFWGLGDGGTASWSWTLVVINLAEAVGIRQELQSAVQRGLGVRVTASTYDGPTVGLRLNVTAIGDISGATASAIGGYSFQGAAQVQPAHGN